MPRKPVHRSLPPLREKWPDFTGFQPTDNATQKLLGILRAGLQRERSDRDAPFYSMRDVAAFFAVPYKTVHRAYQTLEAEGLLRLVRGAHTLARGRKFHPRHPVLGVVGLAIFSAGFVNSPCWRAFYRQLEEALRRQHFVADFILYSAAEEHSPHLADQLLMHEVDVLFWLAPPPWVQQTVHSLLDGGVPVVIWADGKAAFPRSQYRLDVAGPHAEAYALWKTVGIQSVTVLQRENPGPASFETQTTLRALQRSRLPHHLESLSREQFPAAVRRLSRQKSMGVVLPNHVDYQRWAVRYPAAMTALLQRHRVLFAQNPMQQPAFENQQLYADVILDFDPAPPARRIARDLVNPKTWQSAGVLATFRNRFHPGFPLGGEIIDP